MRFLDNDKKWIKVVLGIVLAITYAFANLTQAALIINTMPLLGVEGSALYYVLVVLLSGGMNFLFFYLFMSLSYSIAYRGLVSRTRDVKAMPISKSCFINHVEFVMIFANILIGVIALPLSLNALIQPVLEIVVRMVIKALAYVIVLLLLSKIGIGDNVKKKIFGGFLTSLAVMTALMI